MSKAEDYIEENIKNNANISITYNTGEGISSYSQPWLTPEQARKAVEIAREEMIEKAIEGKVLANGMGNPILHLWYKGRHLIDKKVKVIVIEED